MSRVLLFTVAALVATGFNLPCCQADEPIVDVMPVTQNAIWAVAPDASGVILSTSDGSIAEFLISIETATGYSTAFASVSSDSSILETVGDSGLILSAPHVIQRSGQTAFVIALSPSGSTGSTTSSWASDSWLDNYANWFNSTFGSGWSNAAGGVIHSGLTTVIDESTLANTSDGAILTGTVVVSVPVAVGTVYCGELLLGVGTYGGSAGTAGGGAAATGGGLAGGGAAAGTGGGLVGGTVATTQRLWHIFGNARHNLSALLNLFNQNQAAALAAVQNATINALTNAGITSGTFEITVVISGMSITVRGIIENGVVKIGTFFM